MRRYATRCLLVACVALALSGCGKAANQPASKAAGAQVLPGTISDSMLNLDQSRAQPLLQPAPTIQSAAKGTPTADASEIPADSAPVPPEPAAPAN